jgi:hypothetical protein
MNITLTLTQEETDALATEVARRNANLAEADHVTPESVLVTECMADIKGYVDSNRATALSRIAAATQTMALPELNALATQIEESN